MAFSSMLLGGTTRPPYWNVFFRFCSHALAMPVLRRHYTLGALLMWTADLHWLCVNVCVCVCYPDTVPRRWQKPAAGVSAGRVSGLQSSDGKQSGCTAASSLSGNYHCTTQEHRDPLWITSSGRTEQCVVRGGVCWFAVCTLVWWWNRLTVWSWC